MKKIESIKDLLAQAREMSERKECWIYAAFSDRVLIKAYQPEDADAFLATDSVRRLLELRIFTSDEEWKAFRGDIGRDFYFRILSDELSREKDFFDEEQYINTDGAKLCIRNYVDYYEASGQAYVSDWRITSVRGVRYDGI